LALDEKKLVIPMGLQKMFKSYGNGINKLGARFSLTDDSSLPSREPFLKRPFDFLFSLIGIIISFPIWILVALAIYLEDGFPIIFSQTRLGVNGKRFKIHKFRSMIKDAELNTGPVWAYKKDYRITKVGKFLRKTKLDELPQLFNILMGDMSFVGPRAERPELVSEFRKTIPGFDYRLRVRPGLTGIAQVHGHYNTHPRNKLRYDLVYIVNQSFWLDIKLILASIWYTFTLHWDSKEKRIDKLIGQVILESGVINEAQLEEALKHQEKWGGKVGEILIEKGYITEQKLKDFLNLQVFVNSSANWALKNNKNDYLLGEIMLAANVITVDQLEEALKYQKHKGGRVGQILIDMGYISELALKDCLERQNVARTEIQK
jgi:lipopolysaccharide/colanic/teichoic acid biosynthesis glycosyltransferase